MQEKSSTEELKVRLFVHKDRDKISVVHIPDQIGLSSAERQCIREEKEEKV